MSKPPERYETEGIAKVLKLYLKFFKTLDCFTMQVIYYCYNVTSKCYCSFAMTLYSVDNILRVHSVYVFCPLSRTNYGNWISFRPQVKGWRDI